MDAHHVKLQALVHAMLPQQHVNLDIFIFLIHQRMSPTNALNVLLAVPVAVQLILATVLHAMRDFMPL